MARRVLEDPDGPGEHVGHALLLAQLQIRVVERSFTGLERVARELASDLAVLEPAEFTNAYLDLLHRSERRQLVVAEKELRSDGLDPRMEVGVRDLLDGPEERKAALDYLVPEPGDETVADPGRPPPTAVDANRTDGKRAAMRLKAVVAVAGVLGLAAVTVPTASADGERGRCVAEAAQLMLVGSEVNPSSWTFIGGTAGPDSLNPVDADEVFCGFGGGDDADENLGIFIGGDGDDNVFGDNFGTFDGGPGRDLIFVNNFGTFNAGAGDDSMNMNRGTYNGGEGNDGVGTNFGTFNGGAGDDTGVNLDGIFNGGDGNDTVQFNAPPATFEGGAGDDSVAGANVGTFNGGDGNDSVQVNPGIFNGGDGNDTVGTNYGTFDGGAGNNIVENNLGSCTNATALSGNPCT